MIVRLLLLLLLLFANNVIAEENDREVIDYLKFKKIQKIDNNISHVCHLNNVYIKYYDSFKFRKGLGFISIVWNNETNSPLLCKDYEEYIRNMYNKEKRGY